MADYKAENYKSKLELVYSEGNKELYRFKPSPRSLLMINYEPMSKTRRIRLLLEYLHKNHYEVYYLAVAGKLVGHCVVTPGGRRLKCSAKNDIVIGPYYIAPNERGKGYSKVMLKLVVENCKYNYAYDWIAHSNERSIKTSLSCGFEKIGELNVVGRFRKLVEVDEMGGYGIYRRSQNEYMRR